MTDGTRIEFVGRRIGLIGLVTARSRSIIGDLRNCINQSKIYIKKTYYIGVSGQKKRLVVRLDSLGFHALRFSLGKKKKIGCAWINSRAKANQLTAGQSANSQDESSNIEEEVGEEEEVEQSCETRAGGCVRLIRSPSHPTSRQSTHRLASSCDYPGEISLAPAKLPLIPPSSSKFNLTARLVVGLDWDAAVPTTWPRLIEAYSWGRHTFFQR